MRKMLLLAVTALLVSACAIQPPQSSTGPGGLLMAQADQLSANGEHSQAVALLERALRIDRRNGHAWLRLARLHFAADDLNKAEQFARRAIQFAGADKRLTRACHELLDEISQQQKNAR